MACGFVGLRICRNLQETCRISCGQTGKDSVSNLWLKTKSQRCPHAWPDHPQNLTVLRGATDFSIDFGIRLGWKSCGLKICEKSMSALGAAPGPDLCQYLTGQNNHESDMEHIQKTRKKNHRRSAEFRTNVSAKTTGPGMDRKKARKQTQRRRLLQTHFIAQTTCKINTLENPRL